MGFSIAYILIPAALEEGLAVGAELCSPCRGCGQHRDVGMSQSFFSICGCMAFCLLGSAGAVLALVKQRGVSGWDVPMLYWKRWLPQGARLGGGGCAEVSCTLTLGFSNWLETLCVSRWGDASRSRDGSYAAQCAPNCPLINM